jgi:hypothetical protein
MSRERAIETLYNMHQDFKIPTNFTEDHSEHERAVEQLMELGYLVWEDFFDEDKDNFCQ